MTTYKNLTIVTIPTAQIEKVQIAQMEGKTMGQWYTSQAEKPTYMINASLWDRNGAIGTIWRGGKLVRSEGGGYGFGLTESGWSWGGPWDEAWQDYITGAPALIREGKATNSHMPLRADEVAKTRRSAIAGAGSNLYLITGSGLTLTQFTNQMLEFGVYVALNLDGGGSSRMLVEGVAVNHPTDDRRCPNAIAIWTQEEPSGGKEENTMQYDVCLDPGHGVNTAGKRSPDGSYREYEFNRDMAKRVKAHLERCGLKVCLTVEDDSDPSLSQRCKTADASGAKVVVSLHSNAAGDNWSSANYWMCGITAKGGQAEKLGKAVEAETRKLLDIKNNGVQVQNWAMVRDTKAPAILIEHGFHTNKEWVESVLKTDTGRAKLAQADARGICKHLGVAWVEEQGSWYDKELSQAVEAGITDGTRPNDPATRAEVAVMVLRGMKR